MEFTQEQLESMTDLELNFSAAGLVYNKESVSISNGSVLIYQGFDDGARNYNGIDYCESWGDCGELIDELNLDIGPHFEGGYSVSNATSFSWEGDPILDSYDIYHENIKRAVTVVYILVKQSNG